MMWCEGSRQTHTGAPKPSPHLTRASSVVTEQHSTRTACRPRREEFVPHFHSGSSGGEDGA